MSFEHTAEAVHQELKDNGFYAWPSMVSEPQLARFEQDMSALSESLATKLGVSHEGIEGSLQLSKEAGNLGTSSTTRSRGWKFYRKSRAMR